MNKQNILIVFCILLILLILGILTNYYSFKECLDDSDDIDIPANGVIPDGYYKIRDRKMKKIPYGYTTDSTKTELLPNTQTSFWVEYIKEKDNVYGNSVTYSSTIENTKYNSGNYQVSYHDSPESIKSQSGVYGTDFGTTMVVDPCGNKILIPYNESQGHSIYYEPGSYKYGASTYIPTYEDSVYFSKNNYYGNTSFKPTTKTPSTLKYSRLSKNDGENITYTEPQFIISSTYIPNSEITTYSSKTSGVDTTSIYT
jgi:hypothetical protein